MAQDGTSGFIGKFVKLGYEIYFVIWQSHWNKQYLIQRLDFEHFWELSYENADINKSGTEPLWLNDSAKAMAWVNSYCFQLRHFTFLMLSRYKIRK